MNGKKSGGVGNDRIQDIEDVTPTRFPGADVAGRVDTDSVPRPELSKKGPWFAWVVSLLVLGGVGFAVAWFVMNPAGLSPIGGADGASVGDATQGEETAPDDAKSDVAGADSESVADAVSDSQGASTEDVAGPADAGASDDAGQVDAEASDIAMATADGGGDANRPLDPAEAKRLNAAGYAARKSGDHEKALALYAEALTHNPDDATARYNLACELALAGQEKEALAALTYLYKLGTPEAQKLLAAARDDADFTSLRDLGQFVRLTR
jgi:hypothetical protein